MEGPHTQWSSMLKSEHIGVLRGECLAVACYYTMSLTAVGLDTSPSAPSD